MRDARDLVPCKRNNVFTFVTRASKVGLFSLFVSALLSREVRCALRGILV